MRLAGLPELAEDSVIAHWRAAHRLSRWLTRPAPAVVEHTPGELNLRWEPIVCQSVDGLRLAGWVTEPRRPRATVLLCHGLRRNRQEMLAWAGWLAARGYRSVAFDQRGHGESEGRRTSFGWWERLDVAGVWTWLAERWPRQPRAAIGTGTGAAALVYADAICSLDATVLLNLPQGVGQAFTTLRNASPLELQPFLDMVRQVTEHRLQVPLDQLAPAPSISQVSGPVLVIPAHTPALALAETVAEFLERWLA